MCGIVGYIGNKEVAPILIKGLHQLEYRGYDSAGIALLGTDCNEIKVFKAKGKVANLEEKVDAALSSESQQTTLTTGIDGQLMANHQRQMPILMCLCQAI